MEIFAGYYYPELKKMGYERSGESIRWGVGLTDEQITDRLVKVNGPDFSLERDCHAIGILEGIKHTSVIPLRKVRN